MLDFRRKKVKPERWSDLQFDGLLLAIVAGIEAGCSVVLEGPNGERVETFPPEMFGRMKDNPSDRTPAREAGGE